MPAAMAATAVMAPCASARPEALERLARIKQLHVRSTDVVLVQNGRLSSSMCPPRLWHS
jgi:hypothetical protein